MPVTLTRFAYVAAFLYAAAPAWGAGMPDYGSKNFSPGGATPSYFTNENSAILGTAESDNTDDGADNPADSTPSFSEGRRADRAPGYEVGHHRGKLAGRNFERHATSVSRGRGARAGVSGRTVGRAHSTSAAASARSYRTSGARPAKAAARHTSARSWSRKG
jgi:hypothetical protein